VLRRDSLPARRPKPPWTLAVGAFRCRGLYETVYWAENTVFCQPVRARHISVFMRAAATEAACGVQARMA